MMAASIVDNVVVGGGGLALQAPLNTNISVAVPAHLIEAALQSFHSTYPVDHSSFPTLNEWRKEKEQAAASNPGWEVKTGHLK